MCEVIVVPKLNPEKWTTNRNEIVAVAFKLFAQKGYSRVSVNEIIKEANISKGCFYTYFESKQEVFFAIVENSDTVKSTLSKKISDSMSPEERISEYIRIRLNNFLDESHIQWVKFASEFWATVDFTEEMTLLNQRRYMAFAEDIKSIVEAGIQMGHFRKSIHLEAFVYVLISLINGFANISAVMKHPLDADKIEVAIEMVNSYLSKEAL